MALASKKPTAPAKRRASRPQPPAAKQRDRRSRSAPAKRSDNRSQPPAEVDASSLNMTEEALASLNKIQARFKGRKPVLAEITEIIDDARALQETLLESYEQNKPGKVESETEVKAEPSPVKPRPSARFKQWLDFRKVLKSALGLLIIVYVGWQPMQRLFQISSVEAVVNTHLITLRSPIEGTVTSQLAGLSVGEDIAGTAKLFEIDNPRAEHPRFDDLRRQIAAISDERLLDATKLRETTGLLEEMNAKAESFRGARIRQLQSRINAERSEIQAATARHIQAGAHLRRQANLFSTNTVALSKFQEAVRDERVARFAVTTLQRRLNVLTVELDALKSGVFVGDSYNDMPYSSQRAYDLRQKMIDLEANIKRNDRAMARLQDELAEEEKRAKRLVQADIVAPRKARVWEVLTAPGEQVNRGQELIRLLDCSLPVVTAAVTETVYNRLAIGAPATFRYRQTGEELPGRIVQLTGVASAAANLAIMPNALKKEAYRVMVKVPALAEKANCAIGQTGRVIFDSDSSAAPAAKRS